MVHRKPVMKHETPFAAFNTLSGVRLVLIPAGQGVNLQCCGRASSNAKMLNSLQKIIRDVQVNCSANER